MNGYTFFRVMRTILALASIVLIALGFCVYFAVTEISREMFYRHNYGAEWEARYEENIGPLSKAHERLAAAGVGVVALPCLSFWVVRVLTGKSYNTRGKKKHREKRMSNTERVIRARRNALIWNYFGIGGNIVAAALALFRWGIFESHSDEIVLAMFVFIPSYCSVLAGCWWWLQAKNWPEAVMPIGVPPLAVLGIPFVRVLVLRSPLLLSTSIIMGMAILFTVVAVLPDKSGVGKKPRTWNYKDIGKQDR